MHSNYYEMNSFLECGTMQLSVTVCLCLVHNTITLSYNLPSVYVLTDTSSLLILIILSLAVACTVMA